MLLINGGSCNPESCALHYNAFQNRTRGRKVQFLNNFMFLNSNFNHFRLNAMLDYVFIDYCKKYVLPTEREKSRDTACLTFTGIAYFSPDNFRLRHRE